MQPSIDIPELDDLPKNVQVPTALIGFRNVHHAALVFLMALWQILGFRPGEVTIDFALLGMALRGSERSCRRWLKRLTEAGLVDLIDRKPRGGRIRVHDWRVELSLPPPLPDGRQYRLDFAGDDADDVTPDTLQIWVHRPASRREELLEPPAAG